MKQKRFILVASLAVALVLGMGIAPASAYFTATTTAKGELELNFKPSTEITEWYDGVKHAVISNKADSTESVVVRARVYTVLEYTAVGDGWGANDDGWYYYGKKLEPSEDANELKVTLPKITDKIDEYKASDIGEMYNVIIVYEALPASQATLNGDNVVEFPSDWR